MLAKFLGVAGLRRRPSGPRGETCHFGTGELAEGELHHLRHGRVLKHVMRIAPDLREDILTAEPRMFRVVAFERHFWRGRADPCVAECAHPLRHATLRSLRRCKVASALA
jgi:hypothetical protein